MPHPVPIIVGSTIAIIGSGYAFKKFIYDPHLSPYLEAFLSKHFPHLSFPHVSSTQPQPTRRQRVPVPVPVAVGGAAAVPVSASSTAYAPHAKTQLRRRSKPSSNDEEERVGLLREFSRQSGSGVGIGVSGDKADFKGEIELVEEVQPSVQVQAQGEPSFGSNWRYDQRDRDQVQFPAQAQGDEYELQERVHRPSQAPPYNLPSPTRNTRNLIDINPPPSSTPYLYNYKLPSSSSTPGYRHLRLDSPFDEDAVELGFSPRSGFRGAGEVLFNYTTPIAATLGSPAPATQTQTHGAEVGSAAGEKSTTFSILSLGSSPINVTSPLPNPRSISRGRSQGQSPASPRANNGNGNGNWNNGGTEDKDRDDIISLPETASSSYLDAETYSPLTSPPMSPQRPTPNLRSVSQSTSTTGNGDGAGQLGLSYIDLPTSPIREGGERREGREVRGAMGVISMSEGEEVESGWGSEWEGVSEGGR